MQHGRRRASKTRRALGFFSQAQAIAVGDIILCANGTRDMREISWVLAEAREVSLTIERLAAQEQPRSKVSSLSLSLYINKSDRTYVLTLSLSLSLVLPVCSSTHHRRNLTPHLEPTSPPPRRIIGRLRRISLPGPQTCKDVQDRRPWGARLPEIAPRSSAVGV